MADTTKDIWNDDDGAGGEEKKRSGGFRKFLIFFLTLLAVLGIVLVAAYRDGTGFDLLRRYFNYGGEAADGGTLYDYDASVKNRFAALGEYLVVASDTSIQLLDRTGGEVWSDTVSFSEPAVKQGGGKVVAYDVGGTDLRVIGEKGELKRFTTDEEEPFVSASLNGNGWLAVTTEKKNYKGSVTVYNAELERVFEIDSSSRFVMDAYVMRDNRHLAMVVLGQENSVFVSNIVIYDLSETEPVADYDVTDGLIVEIGEQSGLVATVSDTCLTIAGLDGKVTTTYDYTDKYLRGYDLNGDGFAALLINRYQSGSVGRLVTIGADGALLGSLDVNREVLDLSAAGRYLAVLYADSLVIYTPELRVYATLNGTDFASGVLMGADGAALLLSAEYASVFLP